MFRKVTLMVLVAVMMNGCLAAKPHKRVNQDEAEGQPGLFTGGSGEYTIFQSGGDKRKRY